MYLRDVQSQPAKKRQLRQVKLFEIIDHHSPRHVMGINATWAHHRSMRLMFCLFCFYAGLEQWTWWSHVESEHIRWSDLMPPRWSQEILHQHPWQPVTPAWCFPKTLSLLLIAAFHPNHPEESELFLPCKRPSPTCATWPSLLAPFDPFGMTEIEDLEISWRL